MVTKATPRDNTELLDALADSEWAKEEFATPKKAAAFIEKYKEASTEHDPDVEKQLSDAQKAGVKKLLQDAGIIDGDGKAVKRLPMTESRKAPSSKFAPGADLNGQFEAFGEFLTRAWSGTIEREGNTDERLTRKILGEGQGDQGGFLVPEEFRAEILRGTLEEAVVRPRARVIPMTRETIRIPAIRVTTHASNVYGDVTGYWTPELGTITNSEPTFSQVALTANKLAAITRVGNELLDDSAFALESLLVELFSSALAWFEDDAFINGTGAGQPTGILNADALVTVAKETGQAATSIVWENVIKMFSRLTPQSMGRSVWIAHMDTIPQLASMSLSVGTGGSAMGLAGNAVQPLPNTILGRPIIYSEKAQTLGTAGDLYLCDLGQYLLGDRMALAIASSGHSRFTTDETEWRFIHRVDGRPWVDSAVTPANGSTTMSPFVNLATRA